jgi:parvulin-like peptidyl-prolyl isomerase
MIFVVVLMVSCAPAVEQGNDAAVNNEDASPVEAPAENDAEPADPADGDAIETIVTVNGVGISTEDFQTRVRLERDSAIAQYQQILQFSYMVADPNTQLQYQYYLQQIEQSLEVETFGIDVIGQMIDEVLLVQEAERLGLEVTDQEASNAFYALFGYFPNGPQEPISAFEQVPTSTPSATQLALLTPEPGQSGNGAGQTDAGSPPAESITGTEFTVRLNDYLGRVGEFGVTETTLRELARAQVYREKMNVYLAEDMPYPMTEQVWARHILIQPEGDRDAPDAIAEAEEIVQLLAEGGDFGDLARERSDGPSGPNGGDLGWFERGQMVPEFEEAAFSGEVGEIVGPVETQFGFHVIQVIGKEMRPVSDSEYQQVVFSLLNDLLSGLMTDAEIVFTEGWEAMIPAEPVIPALGE